MDDVQRAVPAAHVGAGKRKRRDADFTQRTETWFLQADGLLEKAASGELAAEQGGGYIDPPWWRALLSTRVGVAAAAVAGVGGVVFWVLA